MPKDQETEDYTIEAKFVLTFSDSSLWNVMNWFINY